MTRLDVQPDWLMSPEIKKLAASFASGEIRFVGGAVRDTVLGRPVQDIDAATTLLPEEVMGKLSTAGIKAIPTGIDHGTVTAIVNSKPMEITTLRRDVATDGRHATVEYTDNWQADASRRDFTMNALYLSPEGEMFDYFGGVDDAKAGRVRFIGDPRARVAEDYLRILRFFRFYAWYGKGEPDAAALAACRAEAGQISSLSGERLQAETFKLLASPSPAATLALMQPEILLQLFGFPIHYIKTIDVLAAAEAEAKRQPNPLLRLAALLPSAAAAEHVAGRWRLSNRQLRDLRLWADKQKLLEPGAGEKSQKKLLRRLGRENFEAIALLRLAAAPEHKIFWQAALKLGAEWLPPKFPITGDDLKAHGMAESKALGEMLSALEEEWEESDYTLTKEKLLARRG